MRLSDDGWCSAQLATDIFDPYIEVDFGRNLLFTSVATQAVESSNIFVPARFVEQYRVEVASEDGDLQYLTLSLNSSQPAVSYIQLANLFWFLLLVPVIQIFPLGQSKISNTNRHKESLPRPVMGQVLRINPYQWNDDDHACTKLEVYGCPLQGS